MRCHYNRKKKRNPDGTGSSGRKRKHGGSYGNGIGDFIIKLGKTLDPSEYEKKGENVWIANYNCPGQIVITGLAEAVAEASEKLKSAGARRVIPLNVSGPFHSAMLITAGKELGKVLEGITLHQLKIPYVTNVTAEYVEDPSETKALLEKQISSSVRWQQSVENMIRQGVDTFVEIGPGRTLAGFMRKIDRNVKVYNIQTVEDAEKVCQELK